MWIYISNLYFYFCVLAHFLSVSFSLTCFCYFCFTATASRWQRGPWRTQPAIDWKWPKALRDYPARLPDLGPGTTAAVPWISWNTFFTFTTWCCLYVPSLFIPVPVRERKEYFISETHPMQERALTQMKDADCEIRWSQLRKRISPARRSSLHSPTKLL